MSWLISKLLTSGLLTKFLVGLLVKYGLSTSVATALVPVAIRSIISLADVVKEAKAEGQTDEEALVAAEENLPPNSPDKKVTVEAILRGEI